MSTILLRLCVILVLGLWLSPAPTRAQDPPPLDRVPFNDQELFLSGGNVAWVNFARDIGPGATSLQTFDEIFRELKAHGGNAMRLWLHTTGAVTPAWDGHAVVGPGDGAIEDLRAILDLAWKHGVGLQLCLWSFDMLRISNGPTITDRAYALLTDPALTQTYIDNALVPMVEALAQHPAVIAWEIFNEPEGMSEEFGWSFNRHVPMSAIQRFVNRTAGAIHRTAPGALVTNGTWSFHALWDRPPAKAEGLSEPPGPAALARLKQTLSARYRHAFTDEEVQAYLRKLQTAVDMNYYTDERLIAAGGDTAGTLDLYNVHYYEWAGTALSPFHHDAGYWGLDKPLVVAEFFMGDGDDGDPDRVFGVPYQELYETLFERGYAGALAWQWYNYPVAAEGVVNWPRMLANMDSLRRRYPRAVRVDPGLRIASFTADPPGIEQGQSSRLAWFVSGASTVTLDGEPVDSSGTRTVTPDITTTYTLVATARTGDGVDTARVTVEVLDPDQVNRARARPAVASTIETCCGNDLTAGLAVDGDPNTRWSSEWQEGLADDDPDDEWIYVELAQAYDLQRIVLRWEAAYGRAYDIDVSYDARTWTTVYEERDGDGGVDEIVFDVPPSARYVRLHGRERATQWGYSLWEFEVYGLPSARQPPDLTVVAPPEGGVIAPGSTLTLTAEAADPDGTVQEVVFYADGDVLGTATAPPFSVTWADVPAGAYEISAAATDDDGLRVSSAPVRLYVVDTTPFQRYEAEAAGYAGEVSVKISAAASGRAYLDLRDNGVIAFDEIVVPEAGTYLLTLRYNLAYGGPKEQTLVVNGDTLGAIRFGGAANTWLQRGVNVALQGGANAVALHASWGWMYLDYASVGPEAINVATDASGEMPETVTLAQNYPNPFNPSTVITYTLPEAAHVRLDVFDVTGRRVAVLVDEVRPMGTHTVRFDARHLVSGVYGYRLQAGTVTRTGRMVLLR